MAFNASEWESLICQDRFREALSDTVTLDQAQAVIRFGLELLNGNNPQETRLTDSGR